MSVRFDELTLTTRRLLRKPLPKAKAFGLASKPYGLLQRDWHFRQ